MENDMENLLYRTLPHSKLKIDTIYHLPDPLVASPVSANSPAVDVMTDLRRTTAITVLFDTPIDDANLKMIAHRIRKLIVVDDLQHVIGIITSTDILGEKSLQFTHQRGARHAEILVSDVMTPSSKLEVIDLPTVLKSKVGDIMETLKHTRRQHALVVDEDAGGRQMVRGIFSTSQIARQLNLAPSPVETGNTFAEFETAIGA
jgi:CBS domain-containing protein